VKVLVDTSVWSLALRRKSVTTAPQAVRLADLIASGQPVFLTGVILLEILRSIRHRDQFLKIQKYLESFPILELDRSGYTSAALLGSHCRSKGVQGSTVDILIAQIAISNGCHLLTADGDFAHIARHSELKLL
jgi:predicted nucleic acid-binding protein